MVSGEFPYDFPTLSPHLPICPCVFPWFFPIKTTFKTQRVHRPSWAAWAPDASPSPWNLPRCRSPCRAAFWPWEMSDGISTFLSCVCVYHMCVYMYIIYTCKYVWILCLVGGFTPAEKYQSIGMIIPNIWKNIKCSKPPTRYSDHITIKKSNIVYIYI